jgi:hypothetical protein
MSSSFTASDVSNGWMDVLFAALRPLFGPCARFRRPLSLSYGLPGRDYAAMRANVVPFGPRVVAKGGVIAAKREGRLSLAWHLAEKCREKLARAGHVAAMGGTDAVNGAHVAAKDLSNAA